ncbi:MAG: SH3 domain-containing protein [Pseudomonadota bacterium]
MIQVGSTATGYACPKALGAAFCAALLLASPVQAETLPSLAQVTGISAGDVLNVRDGAGAQFADIGDLNAGAQVEVIDYSADGTWAQITWQEGNAWVAARYLEDVPQPQLESGLPVGLRCSGGEPFWSLTLSETGTATFSSPAGSTENLVEWSAPSQNEGTLRYAFTSSQITGVLSRSQCIAAGTGQTLGWTLDVILTGDANALLSGCCTAN